MLYSCVLGALAEVLVGISVICRGNPVGLVPRLTPAEDSYLRGVVVATIWLLGQNCFSLQDCRKRVALSYGVVGESAKLRAHLANRVGQRAGMSK